MMTKFCLDSGAPEKTILKFMSRWRQQENEPPFKMPTASSALQALSNVTDMQLLRKRLTDLCKYVQLATNFVGDTVPESSSNLTEFEQRKNRAMTVQSSCGPITILQRHCKERQTFLEKRTDPATALLDCGRLTKDMIESGRLVEAWIKLNAFTSCFESIHGVSLSEAKRSLHSSLDTLDIEFLQSVLVFFMNGYPPFWEEHHDNQMTADLRNICSDNFEFRARQEVLQAMTVLARMDLSEPDGLTAFGHLSRSVDIAVITPSIHIVANSTGRDQDTTWQETKLYANLVLTLTSCHGLRITQALSSPQPHMNTAAMLNCLEVNTLAQRCCGSKQILDKVICLLDAFNQLCLLDRRGTASNWLRVQCALFAGSLIEVSMPNYEGDDPRRARKALARFEICMRAVRKVQPSFEPFLNATIHRPKDMSVAVVNDSRMLLTNESSHCGANLQSRRSEIYADEDRIRHELSSTLKPSLPSIWSSPELAALQAYLEITARMMNRSSKAPFMWYILIPQMASQHQCVRCALMACAGSSKALLHSEDALIGSRRQAESEAIRWSNQAIRFVLQTKPPMHAVLLTSLLLSCVALLSGRPEGAIMHIRHGFRLADSYLPGTAYEEAIHTYCRTFMDSLTSILYTTRASKQARRTRIFTGLSSLLSGYKDIRGVTQSLKQTQIAQQQKLLFTIANIQQEIEWLVPRWHRKLVKEEKARHCTGANRRPISSQNELSHPWAQPVSNLQKHLHGQRTLNVMEFEIAMERAMPLFALSISRRDIDMREETAELMMMGPVIRGKF